MSSSWLDAPDHVLAERINSRSKAHRLKGASSEAAVEALAESRTAYEHAISRLTARRDAPAILRFDTDARPAAEIADSVLAAVAGDNKR